MDKLSTFNTSKYQIYVDNIEDFKAEFVIGYYPSSGYKTFPPQNIIEEKSIKDILIEFILKCKHEHHRLSEIEFIEYLDDQKKNWITEEHQTIYEPPYIEKKESEQLEKQQHHFKNHHLQLLKIIKEDILDGIKRDPPPQLKPNKAEALRRKLESVDFFKLESVDRLFLGEQQKLLDLLAKNNLPYQIAMIHHLGFIEHLENIFCKKKIDLYKELEKILDHDERLIRGNILVLNDDSGENRDRYTADDQLGVVKYDYDQLNGTIQ